MPNKFFHFSIIIVLLLLLARPAVATSFLQTNLFSLAEGEVLADELWLSANSIEIKGKVKNDLFLLAARSEWLAAGQSGKDQNEKNGTVLLAGEFANDIWAVGDTVSLSGVAQDHARLLAKVITISGAVSNSAIFIGNSIQLAESAHLGRGVLAAGENVILEGVIEGDSVIVGKSVTLAGNFAGNVRVTAADIVVLPQTRITGNLVYISPDELVLDKNVVLSGQLIREAEPVSQAERRPIISWPSLFMQSWLFIGALCVGILLLALFPAFLDESVSQIQASFWKCLAVGFVAVCLAPFVCFFLALSLIGLPLAVLVAAVFLILSYLSKIAVALMIGALILRRRQTGIKAFTVLGLGLVLLYVAAGAGLSGMIVWFLTVCLGIGGMLLAFLARRTPSAL